MNLTGHENREHVPRVRKAPAEYQRAFKIYRYLIVVLLCNLTLGCSSADTDGDGVQDSRDSCFHTPTTASVDPHGCAVDNDDDRVVDYMDNCLDSKSGIRVDKRGCAVENHEAEIMIGGALFRRFLLRFLIGVGIAFLVFGRRCRKTKHRAHGKPTALPSWSR